MSISVFPLHCRRDLMREVVDGLRTHHGSDANLFWRGMAKKLLNQLVPSGVAVELAEKEVRFLFYAALSEMLHTKIGAPD